MNVPEKFIVYQVKGSPLANHKGWVECDDDYYEMYTGEKRRLAILPEFHIHVRTWFSPTSGWCCTVDVRRGNKQEFKSTFLNAGGGDDWVPKAIAWMITHKLMAPHKVPYSQLTTLFLRETLNIDYDVTEVARKADL